ncbi:MAG: helix-turn-helix transcriptional regulator [Oscillospiraceae bacterium]|nr:helix-turn-helix transcriptional regulator [Oscillospiraceae bacterium]
MDLKLAENILTFRKERALTQEQLAEVLGVSVGAVYKWEAGLSVPELDRIVEMADFFDSSVDVLLGYTLKDNRLKETVQRLKEYRRQKNRAGLLEAEKALKKFPHAFEVVHASATLYRSFGVESGDENLHRRSLELLEQSLLLLPQNTDPEISEQTLYGEMANAYLGLDDTEKAIDLWKAHNAGAMYSHEIGGILAQLERVEEAVPFLSEGMVKVISNLVGIVIGYFHVYAFRRDYASARAILQSGIDFFLGLREANRQNHLDKVNGVLFTALAWSQLKLGQEDEARSSLKKAIGLASFFDESPSYEVSDLRFISPIEGSSAHDSLGPTAMESLETSISALKDEALSALWKSLKEEQ